MTLPKATLGLKGSLKAIVIKANIYCMDARINSKECNFHALWPLTFYFIWISFIIWTFYYLDHFHPDHLSGPQVSQPFIIWTSITLIIYYLDLYYPDLILSGPL